MSSGANRRLTVIGRVSDWEVRFWSKVDRDGPRILDGPCWVWGAATDSNGYGVFRLNGHSRRTHPVSWELHNGEPVPLGLVVRHRCDHPPCVNPHHLLAGTHADNVADKVLRGRAANQNTRKTHCKAGHKLAGENVYVRPDGRGRQCVVCQQSRGEQWAASA